MSSMLDHSPVGAPVRVPVGATLQFLTGPLAGQTISLTKPIVTLGREPHNDIVISEPSVSRSHARIIQASLEWRIEKLAPSNIVTVNQQSVEQKTISNNDVIGLGTHCSFRFVSGAAQATKRPGRQTLEPTALAASNATPPSPVGLPPPPPLYNPPALQTYVQRPAGQENLAPVQPPGVGLSYPPRLPYPAPKKARPARSQRILLIWLSVLAGVVMVFGGLFALLYAITPLPPPTPGPRPGYIIGKVVTSQGNLVENAHIHIEGVGNAGERIAFNTQTSADGTYSLKVPNGTYRVDAAVNVMYQGTSWTLPLHPDDASIASMDSENGIVKNFTWKLSGPLVGDRDPNNPSTYYGGYLMISVQYPPPPDGTIMKFTLTPVGPLVDGSSGQTIVQEKHIQGGFLPNHGYLVDIPLGEYTLTATQTTPDGQTRPLLMTPGTMIGSGYGGTPYESLNIKFQPSNPVGVGNGIEPVSVTVLPGAGQ